MKFLTARWEHLLFANYVVAPELLTPYLPSKTRIDHFDGKCFVSLVAFWFHQTKVLGIKVPFHTQFEEVNLRFYVTPESDHSRRGVTFIREIVPLRIIPWVANSLFRESYVCCSMRHEHSPNRFGYSWANAPQNSFQVTLSSPLRLPNPGSVEEFITEHYWGYAGTTGRTLEYQVEHPQWPCTTVDQFQIAVDFTSNYGERFAILNEQQPHSVLYAAGSDVSVFFPQRL